MTTITNLELIGGHPLIDFVNTEIISHGERVDLLTTAADYLTWLHHAGLITEETAALLPPTDLLPQIRHTRQQMRELLQAIVNKQPVPEQSLTTINGLLAQRNGRRHLTQHNGRFTLTYTYSFTQPAEFLAPIADTAADLLTTADFQRLKRCANPDCIRYFLDESRNRSRRWCAMEVCGNRIKARTFYHRHNQS